jgi:hypothetical protein
METRKLKPPFDIGYMLGLSGPSQGATTRTDHVADVTLTDMSCGAIAEATNITVTITELTYAGGSKYAVTLEMDVKPLGNCRVASGIGLRNYTGGAWISVEIRDVNRGFVIAVGGWPFLIDCEDGPFHFSQFRDVDAGGWLQDWASTTLRLQGAWEPCG